MRTFTTFDSWDAVLEYVTAQQAAFRTAVIYYQAPLDTRPVMVDVQRRGRGCKLRIVPAPWAADPFWADAGHLDRMRRPVLDEMEREARS